MPEQPAIGSQQQLQVGAEVLGNVGLVERAARAFTTQRTESNRMTGERSSAHPNNAIITSLPLNTR